MNKIGILTSGGDAPGMNAAIRAVVRACIFHNIEVVGIKYGYKGLMSGEIVEMNAHSVGDIIHRGGTILKTARSEEFITEAGQKKALHNLSAHKIEGLVIVGGDGSFRGAELLSKSGIKTYGIPGTIDNDLAYTDFTIGFDTAVNTVLDAIARIRDTSSSHEKPTIIEVMGRHCGDIALYAGVAGGAESMIMPENNLEIKEVADKLRDCLEKGKENHIILLAEGSGQAEKLQKELLAETGVESRITVLGFIQRGGDPTMFDRILASKMGVHAVEGLMSGKSKRVVGIKNNSIFDMEIEEALKVEKKFDKELYRISTILAI